jgi:TubC N-terminal docking domain
MSAALAILKRAQAAGVVVRRDGDQLKLKAPKEPDAELIEELKAHKAELLALLSSAASSAEPILVDVNATPVIETWVRPSRLPFSTDEAGDRITGWLDAMDRLPKACGALAARLKTLTEEFALGVWSYPCVQSGWSDLALFAFDGGLVPEMSRRALHFRCVAESVIVLMNERGALEDWRRQHMPDGAVPWWQDEKCVGRFH